MAKGRKIFFWDSDDTMEQDTIEKCVRFSAEHDVQAVLYGYADRIEGIRQPAHPSKLKTVYRKEEIVNELMPAFLGHSYDDVNAWIQGKVSMREGKEATALWRIMLDAETIRNYHLRFDTQLSLGEDTKFINEYLLRENAIGYLDECLYYLTIRQSGANLTSQSDPVRMMNDKLKLIQARKEIDQQALALHHVDTHAFWVGTVVFSAVQLALRFAKNSAQSFQKNYADYAVYMSNPEVKQCVQAFRPARGVKAIPFIFVKASWKFFFVLAKIVPNRIMKKIL